MGTTRVLVIGDVMQDVIVRPEGPLRRGTDQRAQVRIGPGGAGTNQSVWLAHFGVPVRLLACVGRSDLEARTEALRRVGVEPVLLGHPTLPTGALVAMVDQDGERSFLTERGANDGLGATDLPDTILDGVGHLHLSGYALVGAETRATVLGLIERARREALTISFDPGSGAFLRELGGSRVLEMVGRSALCVLNGDEAAALTDEDDPDRQLARLGTVFDLTVLKRGGDAALARAKDGQCWQACPPKIPVIDTTGAGDAFLAAFLARWLDGSPIDFCLDRAVTAGAAVISRLGGWPEP